MHCRRVDWFIPEVQNELMPFKRQGETISDETPIFDQHVQYLTNLPTSLWMFPIGIFAVGMTHKDALLEQFDLIYGVIANILSSIKGNLSWFLSTKGILIK